MRVLTKDPNRFVIVDEVLDKDTFEKFWKWFEGQDFSCPHLGGWQKVWRLADGMPYGSHPYYHSKAPFNNELDAVYQNILFLARENQDVCGEEGKDWDEIVVRPYIYTAGCRLSWHNDPGYASACIFYPHKIWHAHWGGELFIALTPPSIAQADIKSTVNEITREWYSDFLNKYGLGTYVAPIPNRAVFTKGDVWHAINRVDQTAGDNIRCSVVCFFKKGKEK
jgi:hypothetical protein